MEPSSHSAMPDEIKKLYEVHEWRNAITVLSGSYHEEWLDVLAVLSGFRLAKSHLVKDTAASNSPNDATAAAMLPAPAASSDTILLEPHLLSQSDGTSSPSQRSRSVCILRI